MLVIPAIDLYDGRVVRMVRGERRNVIFYDVDPITKLEEFIDAGLRLVHIVDLSRAIERSDANRDVLKRIADLGLARFVQLGGGIRATDYSLELLSMGFKRQILTSLVLNDPGAVRRAVEAGVEVVFSLDTDAAGNLKFAGWSDSTAVRDLSELGRRLREIGVAEVIHTDTDADGTLSGRPLETTERIAVLTGLSVIVAGGVKDATDLENIRRLSEKLSLVKGVIVGRAHYEGTITVEEMVRYAR